MKFTILAALLLTNFAFAQAPAPQITDDQRAEFFKAKSNMTDAIATAVDARTKYQEAIQKLQAVCGTSTLTMSQSGDPVCAAKQAAKPEKK
jgi:hypothetical protein